MTINKKISIVIGGAGFVGSNLIPSLLEEGLTIFVGDNFSRGSMKNLSHLCSNENIHILIADFSVYEQTFNFFSKATQLGETIEVWHLAANSDIPAGVDDFSVDLNHTFHTTFNILKCMKLFNIGVIHFASSSAIYGDMGTKILDESSGPLLPISNYGAMKLASEAVLSAASESFLTRVNIFRFPNVVGVPATHGVILDFINKLSINPCELHVLGDGSQKKSYLHINDLVSAMFFIRKMNIAKNLEVFNIGPTDDGVTVKSIAEMVVSRISSCAQITYGIEKRGWVGDVPRFVYSTEKLKSCGWHPKLSSKQAIVQAINEIALQLGR